jgi:hypothetical protein
MSTSPVRERPLAGSCCHQWVDQESDYLVAQVCALCRLFRYKASVTADWEYRAPIPFGRTTEER